MSIDRMENILLVVQSSARDRFIDWLYSERQVHLEDFRGTPEEWSQRFVSQMKDSTVAETQVSRLQSAVDSMREYHKKPGDFLESLFPVKTLATIEQVQEAASEVSPDFLSEKCQELNQSLSRVQDESTQLASERARYEEFSFLPVDVDVLRSLKHCTLSFVSASGQTREALVSDTRFQESALIEPVVIRDTITIYVMAAPASQADVLSTIIADYGLRELTLPTISVSIAEAIKTIDARLQDASKREQAIRDEGVKLSKEWLLRADLALAYWESELNCINQRRYMVSSPHVFAARGYIRAKHLNGFRSRLEQTFPGAELEIVPLPTDTEPPVSMSWNSFLRPAGLLVKMFGLPSYKEIDPTPFLTLTFLLFFGICFGDVLYGFMLLGLAAWLKHHFRDQEGLVQFFKLFTYAGYSTVFFGFLVGSWGADLTMYFGEGNLLDTLRLKLTVLDPLAKPVAALGIAAGIGVVNQLYGIFMRFLRDLKKNDIASAIFDGVFWMTYLISLLVAIISAILGAPGAVVITALIILGCSALGLVLTQGRAEKTWAGRLVTGVVSLYGIMGTYGTTSFTGDVISYSRLMALGLTTSVVGMSFNIIGGILKDIPVVGWVLFAIVVIFGHVFNFVMSILSAFVHSARLILLEWFGRFYEGGGVRFKPYGFNSEKLDLIEQ